MTSRAFSGPPAGPAGDTEAAPDGGVSSDAELVAAICRAEAGATLRLYRLVVPVVDRTLLRVLGCRDRDHEDLVQLSLEHLLRSILDRKFRLECGLQHWTAALSARVAISELRRRARTRAVLTEPRVLDEEGGERLRAWQHATRADEARDLIRRALGSLRPERAQVVYLYEVEGFQLAEIAAMMQVSVSAVQSRLVRGRSQLADYVRRANAAVAEPQDGGGQPHE